MSYVLLVYSLTTDDLSCMPSPVVLLPRWNLQLARLGALELRGLSRTVRLLQCVILLESTEKSQQRDRVSRTLWKTSGQCIWKRQVIRVAIVAVSFYGTRLVFKCPVQYLLLTACLGMHETWQNLFRFHCKCPR